MAGAFTIAGLTNPVYYVRTGDDGIKRVFEDTGQQDAVRLGVGAFVHLYKRQWPWWSAISFGLGIREDNKAEYYVGTGLRLGDRRRC